MGFIYENCNGCGACVSACENGAIALARDSGKGKVLDVDLLVDSYT